MGKIRAGQIDGTLGGVDHGRVAGQEYPPARQVRMIRKRHVVGTPRPAAGGPHLTRTGIATTTRNGGEELGDSNDFDIDEDRPGPFSVAIAVEALAPIGFAPQIVDGKPIRTNLVVIGDADFASDRSLQSAETRASSRKGVE